jgi:hypothetical protein
MTTLAEQIAALESKLAAYESRKVPLSAVAAGGIFRSHPGDADRSHLAVARVALVAAESPDAVKVALKAWDDSPGGGDRSPWMLAAIRAAHDAAIDGGCGAARESEDCNACLLANKHVDQLVDERDDLRRQLGALTRPIDGVEELGRIGWEAWQRAEGSGVGQRRHDDHVALACDNATAQAIASRVIDALRSALLNEVECADLVNESIVADAFDSAVASLKIEPAKVEPATPVDTRPVVKVGQVWTFEGNVDGPFKVDHVKPGASGQRYARTSTDEPFMLLGHDGRPHHNRWVLVSDAPPKCEPFELPGNGRTFSVGDGVAIRDRIQEIERRLEAGGL